MLDLVIVGGGPAGIGAGIQARHMGLEIMILDREGWGGRLSLARKVENFPGIAGPMSGPQVVEALVTQACNKGLNLNRETVDSIDFCDNSFVAQGRTDQYACRAIIVATGVRPKRLSIPGIGDRHNRLFYTWQEIPFVRHRSIAVIGGGEAAFDQACSLADRGATVTVLVRGRNARAFDGLVRTAQELGVQVILHTSVTRADQEGDRLTLSLSDPERDKLHVDYILASVGVVPSDVSFSKQASARADRGLYQAGDVCSQNYRQAAIAFGDGIKKAMIAYEYVKG
jgi:thioredoxin reductase (NADPH)